MKYHFFSRLAIPTNFLLYPLITLAILHTAFGLIWTTPWPDEKEKKNFLRILNNSQFAKFANLQIFVWKTFFFLNKLYQQLLGYTLSLHRWYSMPSLVWFGQLLDPMKKNFLKFSKTRNSRNSQNSVWKPNFFLGMLYQFFFAVHSYYTGDTQYRVWFDLDNSLIRWKRIFLKFSKIRNSRNLQNSVWKSSFFLGKLYQQLFCFSLSLHWWYSIPSLVWFGQLLDPMKKNFLKFSKTRNSRNSQNSVWKPNFFLGTLYHFFCCTLLLHWWYSIPSLVWFGQLLDPMKKNFFKILKKSQFAKFAKLRMKYHFFSRLAIPTNFLLYPLITLAILHTALGLIWTTPWPDEKEKKNFLRILNNSQFAKFANFCMKNLFFPKQAIPTTFWLYTVITLAILNTEFSLIWTIPRPNEKDFF